MTFPHRFTSIANFELAFTRIVRGQNKEYKTFFRHLYPSYQLSLRDNLEDLVDDIKRGRYEPSSATCIYQPKKSGVLRPLRLLTLQDQIVYQAIANVIAIAYQPIQDKLAFKRCFGAIAAGKESPFFYRGWRYCYRKFDQAVVKAFKAGNEYVADFDLVSFFELIDHKLLKDVLTVRFKQPEILTLLFKCLEKWTEHRRGSCLQHGIPQGPEASAFLAECFLFSFDRRLFRKLVYLRYVDDIRLMAKTEPPVRRALLRLDIASKHRGLVPQAQKIECRRVTKIDELRKNVPSNIAAASRSGAVTTATQRRLERIFKRSIRKEKGKWVILDVTKFKFVLFRMRPKRIILRRVSSLVESRPDLSWLFASYFRLFPEDQEAADILLAELRRDPTYDASAANYIGAMDVCEPPVRGRGYRRVIQTAEGRSEEKSIVLKIASTTFRGRRSGPKDALKLVRKLTDPLARSIVLHHLFGRGGTAVFKVGDAVPLLDEGTKSADADLARFCTDLLLDIWPWTKATWTPDKYVNRSSKLLMKGIGLRARAPKKRGVLDKFFEDRMGIGTKLNWRKALKGDWRDAERRCLRVQDLEVGDPGSWLLMIDTFNELLIQRLSKQHPALSTAFKTATPPKAAHPDFGNWLRHPALMTVLPKGIGWLTNVHDERVKADLAHAKSKKGRVTKAVSFSKRDRLSKGSKIPWAELITQLKAVT